MTAFSPMSDMFYCILCFVLFCLFMCLCLMFVLGFVGFSLVLFVHVYKKKSPIKKIVNHKKNKTCVAFADVQVGYRITQYWHTNQ